MAVYSDTLKRALALAGLPWAAIEAGVQEPRRLMRWVRAANPRPRRLDRHGTALFAPDLFREAQVFFDLHGRVLELDPSDPEGVVHWTYPVPIRIKGWRNVYTFHDVIPLVSPDLSPIDPRRYRRMHYAILRRADRIVTVSAASKHDIEATLPCSCTVENLGQAVDVAAAGPPPYDLRPGSYLLCCGTIEPRKNITRLIHAYVSSSTPFTLVLAGPPGRNADPIIQLAMNAAGVLYLPSVPRNHLVALLAGARALLMPSLAEGFGLPVAEAMWLGTPVVTSDRGALAEVADGAALFVDPEDISAIAVAIARISVDDGLVQQLIQRGSERAQAFSLATYGMRLLAFYQSLLPV